MRILITTGATIEPFDSVRFLSNRSSGQLGSKIGLTAAIRGHDVTILHGSGCVSIASHPRVYAVPFDSTRDLHAKLMEAWPSNDLLIMAAAVSDFTPKGGQTDKKSHRSEKFCPEFTSTEDLVAHAASTKREDQRIIAFALGNSSDLEQQAKDKLKRKGVDAIVANAFQTMESKDIHATLILQDGTQLSPDETISKSEFAIWLLKQAITLMPPVHTRTNSRYPV